MRTIPVGPTAVLAEVGDALEALALARWARAERLDAAEVIPAARTVLFDGVLAPALLARRLADWSGATPELPTAEVVLPVHYDGADLDDVARRWGMTRAEAVATHTRLELVVAFCGFAPGFAYLAGLPTELAVPRLPTPRTQVPAGSVAVADVWCGVYPGASPGGWRLLGRTDATLWDSSRAEPALLPPGTRVRFAVASDPPAPTERAAAGGARP